jgi:hypothetical protein
VLPAYITVEQYHANLAEQILPSWIVRAHKRILAVKDRRIL